MPDREKDPPDDESEAALDDEDASDDATGEPLDEEPSYEDGADGSPGVSDEVLRAFLSLESTLARMRQVIKARTRGLSDPERPDILQSALERAWKTKARARSEEKLRPWISQIAANAALDHLRRNEVDAARHDREADVEQIAATSAGTDASPEKWMLGPWLEKRVAGNPTDEETLEMLRKRARKLTYEQIAAEHGTTVYAINNRVLRFRKKYGEQRERWRKRQRTFLLLLLFGGFLALVAALVWRHYKRQDVTVPDTRVLPNPVIFVAPDDTRPPVSHPPPADSARDR
jgi:RNA polymerase sigma factor (sigma-70 family)